ncbi:hypothetical protein BC939DRAFT_525260 [Gamsiella multidivaricata]|uniref:uncharacterized protein n=1 Tax=Gamsiella multidivaricata TaxID=101098 RepID=UPI00222129E3|nr:uncharacterized protein BC939DRAFT_525260 [Gamsiella multidivaricata]KAG0362174.1 hypothetical protein BGZ54_008753 [Gamsiella multidivaricata]KAI7831215.1 hypothetical protein BC939DRAFT_525260 [Gamsiella multidivaricata]
MHRITIHYTTSRQTAAKYPHVRQYIAGHRLIRNLSTSTTGFQDGDKTGPDNTISSASEDDLTNTTVSEKQSDPTPVPTTATNTTDSELRTKEDFVKKFRLKPSVEVGIRARFLEKQRKQAEEEAARLAAKESEEVDSNIETGKIQRLFEKLQLNGDTATSGSADVTGTGPNNSQNVSDSWKFLFDEDDLGDKKATEGDSGDKDKDMLDRIPGASELFPSLSEHRAAASTTVSEDRSHKPSLGQHSPSTDRWKDPRMKSTERDAFKALFSSLFEQKKPEPQETSVGGKMQSLFSNFNRTGLDDAVEGDQTEDSGSLPLFGTLPASSTASMGSQSSDASTDDDPMQVLRRQLQNLSKRVEPIYLERKPKTPSFQVMENTVGPQDWMTRDPSMPQENNLFNAIREENKVAIRMRKELEEKQRDIIKVKEFVDELIEPFVQPPSPSNADVVRPSSVSLDSLLAQAILAASSSSLEVSSSGNNGEETNPDTYSPPSRSLHPFMGHALVEHTRRQGLPVFIRTVRTESYKALLKSRWNAWHDGPGCLEILREMQRSGALVDGETKSLVRNMRKELRIFSLAPSSMVSETVSSKEQLQQYGWGDEEQAAPLVEMLNIIKAAHEDGDHAYDMKQWAKRAEPRSHSSRRSSTVSV